MAVRLVFLCLLVLPFCGGRWNTLVAQKAIAQRVKSIRVEGSILAKFPLALLSSHPITISFDVDTPHPEYFRVKVIHCDRNWKPTVSAFINDESLLMPLAQIPYEEAPPTITTYRWTYSFQLPGFVNFERFRASGNYRIEIWNRTATELVATAKILIAEEKIDSLLWVEKYSLPSASYPWYQAHRILLQFLFPSSNDQRRLDPNFLRAADIFVNRKIEYPQRIDIDDNNPFTFVKGVGTGRLMFQIDNILPGNEYRVLDFRDGALYPLGKLVRTINGADVSRFFQQGNSDHDGMSFLVVGNRFAEYENVQFELLTASIDTDSIYVVGDFNGWYPSEEWRLAYDSSSERYHLTAPLRRGLYDYQYVRNNDWYALEGNDWRTENVYTAVLYYYETSLGGYDRILLCAQQKTSGVSLYQTN